LLKLATPTIGPPLPGICPNVLEDPKPLLPDDPKPPLPDDPKLLPLDDPKLDDPNELPLLPPNALGDEPLEAELSPEFPPLFALPLLDPPLEESVVVEEVSQFDELLLPPKIDDPDPIVDAPPLVPVTAAPPNAGLPPSWLADDPGDPPNALALVLQFGFVFPPVPVCP
jgi:hypothetical protein